MFIWCARLRYEAEPPQIKLNPNLFSVYEIHDHLDKDVNFVHSAFGNHQGQCDKGAVGDSLGTVCTVEDAVVLKAVACLELIR